MIRACFSEVVAVPRQELFDFMVDYRKWPKIYPNIVAVVPSKKENKNTHDDGIELEVLESDGESYTIVQRARRPDTIVKDIERKTLSGNAVYNLDVTTGGGTLLTFTFELKFKGVRRRLLATLFLKNFVAKHLRAAYFEPLKNAAEKWAAETRLSS